VRLGILRALSARRSLSLFLAVVVCLAIWQIWLTWRLMEQDRNLELQRSRERLEQIADLAVAQPARPPSETGISPYANSTRFLRLCLCGRSCRQPRPSCLSRTVPSPFTRDGLCSLSLSLPLLTSKRLASSTPPRNWSCANNSTTAPSPRSSRSSTKRQPARKPCCGSPALSPRPAGPRLPSRPTGALRAKPRSTLSGRLTRYSRQMHSAGS